MLKFLVVTAYLVVFDLSLELQSLVIYLVDVFLILMAALDNSLVSPESGFINALLLVIKCDVVLAYGGALVGGKLEEKVLYFLFYRLEVKHVPKEEVTDSVERVRVILKQPME